MRFPPPVFASTDVSARNWESDQFELGALTNIVLAHDYICPWCYVGYFHARRLMEEFSVTFDWRGFELIPPGMEYNPGPPKPVDPNAPPPPPSRFDKFAQEEGLVPPSPRPRFVRSHAALLGAEWALLDGGGPTAQMTYHDAVYRGYWERRVDISDVDALAELVSAAGLNGAECADAVRQERWAENVVPYDDGAYSVGIRHVPTFLYNGEEKLAEAEYIALANATERFLIRAARFTSIR